MYRAFSTLPCDCRLSSQSVLLQFFIKQDHYAYAGAVFSIGLATTNYDKPPYTLLQIWIYADMHMAGDAIATQAKHLHTALLFISA